VNERLYKRKIRLLISIVLVLVMAFSGCNGKQKKQERKQQNRNHGLKNLLRHGSGSADPVQKSVRSARIILTFCLKIL